jgi:hypothetical protein
MNAAARTVWIIDRKSDLRWLVGSVTISYAFVAAHVWSVPVVLLWWAWVIGIDGPHIFATLARTYLDREEWQTRGRVLRAALGWFLAGPLAFALAAGLSSPMPFLAFLALANLWAYWHVVRQHYGFMMLYKRKAGDMAPADNRIDSAFLYVGLIAPFVAFALTHSQARRVLGLSGEPTWERAVAAASWALWGLVVVMLLAHQVARWRRALPVNRAKLLYFAAAIPLSAIVFSPAVATGVDLVAFVFFVTAFHNVQYHAIVWFYARNRYRVPGGVERFGLAARLTRRFGVYALVGIAFTLFYRLAGCALGATPGCSPSPWDRPLAAGLTLSNLAMGFFWGFALHHYYLDQKIWRVGRDTVLKRDLTMSG